MVEKKKSNCEICNYLADEFTIRIDYNEPGQEEKLKDVA